MTEWNKFPEELPATSGTYDVVVAHEKGSHAETAEYSSARKIFLWYSRRGYPFEITAVTHWRKMPDLPLMEEQDVSESRTQES